MQAGVKIGHEYLIHPGHERDLAIRVVVRDLREVWGSPQARVEPVAGSGLVWVMVGRLLPVPSKGQSCGLPLGHRCDVCDHADDVVERRTW